VGYLKKTLISVNKKGQASLEYLLLITSFFSILVLTLPAAFSVMDSFLSVSDDLVAESIASELKENISLMGFLGDGTVRVFEYSPSKSISFSSAGSKINIFTESKNFEIETGSVQLIPRTVFEKKFAVKIEKLNKNIVVFVSS
jgi:uncharacterized protein (UPF0333 family)